jgi:GDP-L-fucose synthase
MVGSAICRRLAAEDCEPLTVTRREVDLKRQKEVEEWMAETKPEAVFVAAATVGGILANSTRPAEFIYDNLAIETNIIHAAWKTGVEKLMFLGSSCIYPKQPSQPVPEEALLTGPLEPTNQWYAIAKICGIKMCEAYRKQYGCDYISAQPTNLYGPGDNFDLKSSHVIPALLVKAHQSKENDDPRFVVWGSGKPRREFLYIDDLADALVFLMTSYSDDIQINIGSGTELTIAELAKMVAEVVGYSGQVVFDSDKPDGVMRRRVDTTRLNQLGWTTKTEMRRGLILAYEWYRKSIL